MIPVTIAYTGNSKHIAINVFPCGIPVIIEFKIGQRTPTIAPSTGPNTRPPIKAGICNGENSIPPFGIPWNAYGNTRPNAKSIAITVILFVCFIHFLILILQIHASARNEFQYVVDTVLHIDHTVHRH